MKERRWPLAVGCWSGDDSRSPAAGGQGPAAALRLGHIAYSNCLPVHNDLLAKPGALDIVQGEPSVLNRMLECGKIDVAPCSSIEYARHPGRYRILPDLSISCAGPVRSILLLSDRPPADLAGCTVALPSASATSVVLLRILLRRFWKVECELRPFDQGCEDPFAQGASAALFIGDTALARRRGGEPRLRTDLGEAWQSLTGLPFVYALWQTTSADDAALARLHRSLVRSRERSLADLPGLARAHTGGLGMSEAALVDYWETLRYDLDHDLVAGLTRFYELAAEEGEIAGVPELRFAGVEG